MLLPSTLLTFRRDLGLESTLQLSSVLMRLSYKLNLLGCRQRSWSTRTVKRKKLALSFQRHEMLRLQLSAR